METRPALSVLIPFFNEEGNVHPVIDEVHEQLSGIAFEVICVNDCSADATAAELAEVKAKHPDTVIVLNHVARRGKSAALFTGLKSARGEWVQLLDGDGQNDPADIPAMLQKANTMRNPDFCIAGYRKNRKDTAWKRFQSRLANRVRDALLHDGVPDTGCGLKLFPRETFLKLPWFDHGHRFIPALVRGIGGDIAIVEVNHRPRTAGISKYNAWNRTWAGILDLLGVLWLLHRTRVPVISSAGQADPQGSVAERS